MGHLGAILAHLLAILGRLSAILGPAWALFRRPAGSKKMRPRRHGRAKFAVSVFVHLGTVFGPSWRILGPFWVDLPPPGGARGAVPEGIFEGFFGTSRPRGKNCAFFEYLKVVLAQFLSYMLSSVAFLAAWPAAPRICKHLENPLVFVGRKPYAPFSRSARNNRISEDTRSQH